MLDSLRLHPDHSPVLIPRIVTRNRATTSIPTGATVSDADIRRRLYRSSFEWARTYETSPTSRSELTHQDIYRVLEGLNPDRFIKLWLPRHTRFYLIPNPRSGIERDGSGNVVCPPLVSDGGSSDTGRTTSSSPSGRGTRSLGPSSDAMTMFLNLTKSQSTETRKEFHRHLYDRTHKVRAESSQKERWMGTL